MNTKACSPSQIADAPAPAKIIVGTGFWALADQGVVSLGNFLTNIVLARILAPREYGEYAIVLSVLLFLNGLHGALIVYPLSVRGAGSDQEVLRKLVTFSAGATGALGLILGTGLFLVLAVFHQPFLGMWAGIALLFWILQETFRRALMSQMRFAEAFWGDAVSYLGQAMILVSLGILGRVSLNIAFLVIAATSAAAGTLQLVKVGIGGFRAVDMPRMFVHFWDMGRWLLLNNFIGVFSVQLFPWLLGSLRTVSEAGIFQVLVNAIGMTNPILISCSNWVIPATAKAYKENGSKVAQQTAVRLGILGAILVIPCFAILMFCPIRALSILYGRSSPYVQYSTGLRVLVAGYTINYLAIVVSSFFNGIGKSQIPFTALTLSAVVGLVVGVPLIARAGVVGATVAVLVSTFVRTGVLLLSVRGSAMNVEYNQAGYEGLL